MKRKGIDTRHVDRGGATRARELELDASYMQQKAEYQKRIESALAIAADYTGTEQEYHQFMTELEAIDAIVQSAGFSGETALQREEQAAEVWQSSDSSVNLSKILEKAGDSQRRYLEKGLSKDGEGVEVNDQEPKKLRVSHVAGVLLPPMPLPETSGLQPNEWKPARFEDRLSELFVLLQKIGVFVDDVSILMGDVAPGMARQETYLAVDIPRLQRMVLLCNQIGESTFVVHGYVSADALLSNNKKQLQEKYGPIIREVRHYNNEYWARELEMFLNTEEGWGEQLPGSTDEPKTGSRPSRKHEKLDVGQIEALRKSLQAQFTPEQWAAITQRERLYLRFEGFTSAELVHHFGADIKLKGLFIDHIRLGLVIFGNDNEYLQKLLMIESRAADDWRTVIKAEYSRDDLLALTDAGIKNFKIDGYGFWALAKIFGYTVTHDISRRHWVLQLIGAVYGHSKESRQEMEDMELEFRNKNRTIAEWQSVIRGLFTPESFLDACMKKGLKGRIDGVRISFVCRTFGFILGDYSLSQAVIMLANAIFEIDNAAELMSERLRNVQSTALSGRLNEMQVALANREKPVEDPQFWRDGIQRMKSAQEWADMTTTERGAFKIEEKGEKKGMGFFATVFGIQGDPYHNWIDALRLGKAIYLDSQALFDSLIAGETRSVDEWKALIQERYSLHDWLSLNESQRRAWNIDGQTLVLIGKKIFGFSVDPRTNPREFYQLSEKIFGAHPDITALIEGKKVSK